MRRSLLRGLFRKKAIAEAIPPASVPDFAAAAGMPYIPRGGARGAESGLPSRPLIDEATQYQLLRIPAVRIPVQTVVKLTMRGGIEPGAELEGDALKRTEALLKTPNARMSLLRLAKLHCMDLAVTDNAWLVVTREWSMGTQTTGPIPGRATELMLLTSGKAEWSAPRDGPVGTEYVRCAQHPDQLEPYKAGQEQLCRECGWPLMPVFVKVTGAGSRVVAAYLEAEVKHSTEADGLYGNPWYGYSKCDTIMELASYLYMTYTYRQQSFTHKAAPDSLFVFKSSRPDTGREMMERWRALKKAALATGERFIPHITVSSEKGAGVELVNFLGKLLEGDSEVSAEIRREIAALWNIPPFFISDVLTSGGLNSESMQTDIAMLGVSGNQNVYKAEVFPWLEEVFELPAGALRFGEYTSDADRQASLIAMATVAEAVHRMGGVVEVEGQTIIIPDQTLEPAPPVQFPASPPQLQQSLSPTITPYAPTALQSVFGAIAQADDSRRNGIEAGMSKLLVAAFDRHMARATREIEGTNIETLTGHPERVRAIIERHMQAFEAEMLADDRFAALAVEGYTLGAIIAAEGDPSIQTTWAGINEEALALWQADPNGIYRRLSTRLWSQSQMVTIDSLLTAEFKKEVFERTALVNSIRTKTADMSYNNAERIARTETTRMLEQARINSYRRHYPGAMYDWHTVGDDRVRPVHRAWGQGGPYRIDEIQIMHDSRGINCRCTVTRTGVS